MLCSSSSVQSFSHVQLFATPWTTSCQATLSITNSRSPPKPMSIVSVMPSNHLILCCPLLLLFSTFPRIRVFSNESALRIRWPNIGVSASASVLPMNSQDWSPLGWTGWTSLQSKGLSRVFSSTTIWKHQFFGTQSCFELWQWNHQFFCAQPSLNFPGGSVVKNPPANAGDTGVSGLIPALEDPME